MSKLKTISNLTATTAVIGLGAWGVKYAAAPAYTGTAGIAYSSAYAPIRDEDINFNIW